MLAKTYIFGGFKRKENGKDTAVYTPVGILSFMNQALHVIKTRLGINSPPKKNVLHLPAECKITSVSTTPLLPREILKEIAEMVCDDYRVNYYLFRDDRVERAPLHYAETILPMDLAKEIDSHLGDIEQPMEGEKCRLDTYFRVSYNYISLFIGSMRVHEFWCYTRLLENKHVFFDGINTASKALVGSEKSPGYELAWFKVSPWETPNEDAVQPYKNRGSLLPFYTSNTGELNALMLHQASDEYVISGKNQSTVFIGNGVLGNPPRIVEIYEFFKKILHVTKSTYLGLLQGGRLASIYFDSNGSIEIATKRVLVEQGSTEEDFFVDLAIDNSCVICTGTGSDDVYTPHVALLNKRGEVFELDLLRPGRPTLFLHPTIERQRRERMPNKIFYDKKKIGLTFHRADSGFYNDDSYFYNDLEIYPSIRDTTYFTECFLDTSHKSIVRNHKEKG
jgi:hypothetical protein